jgi:hypothetical protein
MRLAWVLVFIVPDVFHSTDGPTTPATPRKTTPIDSALRPIENGLFTPPANEAVLAGLMWLSRHQEPDGSWSVTGYANQCEGEAKCLPNPGSDELNTAVTALALHPFIGAGYTHLSRDTYRTIRFGEVVKRGLDHLVKNQKADGSLVDSKHPRCHLVHALAANALAQNYAITASAKYREAAQKSIDYLLACRKARSGWSYQRDGRPDTITTGWAMMALLNAYAGELNIGDPRSLADEIETYFAGLTDPDTARVGYRKRGVDGASIPDRNHRFTALPTCTAIAVLCKIGLDRKLRDSEVTRRQVEILMRSLPSEQAQDRDPHHWFWATQAIFAFDGPSGPYWKKWNPEIKKALMGPIVKDKDKCLHSSWLPTDKWACEGGRVYSVAINAGALLIYYRYPNALLTSQRPLR